MNHFVPDFELHQECFVPTPSPSIAKLKNRSAVEDDDDVMKLLWHQQSFHKSPPSKPTPPLLPPPEPVTETTTQLYIEEDEMATWLHYPFEDPCNNDDDNNDILYSTPPPPPTPITPPPTAEAKPVTLPFQVKKPPGAVASQPLPRNFQMFSRLGGSRAMHEPSTSKIMVSSETQSVCAPASCPPRVEVSPPSASGRCGGATVDRKRKGREVQESVTTASESQHEDVELESVSEKKQHSHGSTSSKRSRASEVHNLSERRRRDRINEKMKALQELIPSCNKADKASMLDEAIEYLKSLQTQVQMMSMGCGMAPMMYHHHWMQPYISPTGLSPFPSNAPGSAFPASPAGSMMQMNPQFTQRLPVPAFPTPPNTACGGPSATRTSNQTASFGGSFPLPSSGFPPQHPNVADPYQQYMTLQQIQMQMQIQMQYQSCPQPSSNNPSTSKDNQDNNNP